MHRALQCFLVMNVLWIIYTSFASPQSDSSATVCRQALSGTLCLSVNGGADRAWIDLEMHFDETRSYETGCCAVGDSCVTIPSSLWSRAEGVSRAGRWCRWISQPSAAVFNDGGGGRLTTPPPRRPAQLSSLMPMLLLLTWFAKHPACRLPLAQQTDTPKKSVSENHGVKNCRLQLIPCKCLEAVKCRCCCESAWTRRFQRGKCYRIKKKDFFIHLPQTTRAKQTDRQTDIKLITSC